MAITPSGFLTSIEALERVGKELFDTAWCGTEFAYEPAASTDEEPSEVEIGAAVRKRHALQTLHRRLEQGAYYAVFRDSKNVLRVLDRRDWLSDDAEWALGQSKWPAPSSDRRRAFANAWPMFVRLQPRKKAGSSAVIPEQSPLAVVPDTPSLPPPDLLAAAPKGKGGRPMSEVWPEWVAELALLIHDEGAPKNTDNLISLLADRLAKRGLDAPARSTVLSAAKAVTRHLREFAGN